MWDNISRPHVETRGHRGRGINLGSHRVAGVREAIEARGASLLFLPPYSPDLNPIEQVFAKLKTLLRRAEPRSRIWQNIGNSLDRYTPKGRRRVYFAPFEFSVRVLTRQIGPLRARIFGYWELHPVFGPGFTRIFG